MCSQGVLRLGLSPDARQHKRRHCQDGPFHPLPSLTGTAELAPVHVALTLGRAWRVLESASVQANARRVGLLAASCWPSGGRGGVAGRAVRREWRGASEALDRPAGRRARSRDRSRLGRPLARVADLLRGASLGRWSALRLLAPAHPPQALSQNPPPEIQAFSVSHGYNLLTLEWGWFVPGLPARGGRRPRDRPPRVDGARAERAAGRRRLPRDGPDTGRRCRPLAGGGKNFRAARRSASPPPGRAYR